MSLTDWFSTRPDQNRDDDWISPLHPVKTPVLIGADAPSVGAALRRPDLSPSVLAIPKLRQTAKKPACKKKEQRPGQPLTLNRLSLHPLSTPSLRATSKTLRDGRQRQDARGPGRSHAGGLRHGSRAVQIKEGSLSFLVWRLGVMLRRRRDASFRFGYVIS